MQPAFWVTVKAQRAADAHQSIAKNNATDAAWPLAGGRSYRVALHFSRQGHRSPQISCNPEAITRVPVLVQKIAITQVGNAGAADLTETGERTAVPVELENKLQ